MAKKTLGKSRKIKPLTNYLGDVGVYDLSKAIKIGKDKFNFLVIAKGRGASGGEKITVWVAEDEFGKIGSNLPLKTVKSSDIAEILLDLGYQLV